VTGIPKKFVGELSGSGFTAAANTFEECRNVEWLVEENAFQTINRLAVDAAIIGLGLPRMDRTGKHLTLEQDVRQMRASVCARDCQHNELHLQWLPNPLLAVAHSFGAAERAFCLDVS